MGDNLRMEIMFAGVQLALEARLGRVDLAEAVFFAERAFNELGPDDAMTSIMADFARDAEIHRRDAEKLLELGQDLHRRISDAAMPVPPGQDRDDIYG